MTSLHRQLGGIEISHVFLALPLLQNPDTLRKWYMTVLLDMKRLKATISKNVLLTLITMQQMWRSV
jgi:hypothetical protein